MMKKVLKTLLLSAVVLAICYIASAFIFLTFIPYDNIYVRVTYVAVLFFFHLYRWIDEQCDGCDY